MEDTMRLNEGSPCGPHFSARNSPSFPRRPPTGQTHLNGEHPAHQEAPSCTEEATHPHALLVLPKLPKQAARNRDNARQDKPSGATVQLRQALPLLGLCIRKEV
ncbi:hypothetical protein APTSU1_001648200 [Apodemus speciosus]|uniref:Uncharacterized protein n=1 Tax=Apodemus speciosus TaxID=105296 RepID=A0ABQ0FPS1_APOSI